MVDVFLCSEIAYQDNPCSESPWGEEWIFNEEIYDWLDEHAGSRYWDHDEDPSGTGAIVSIEDPKVAILFKLTWT